MRTDQIIEELAAELAPVRVLRPPAVRALLWLAVVGVVSAALILQFTRWAAILPRLQTPRVAFETAATALTAITATIAAFELSMPDRSPRWAWLPVPTLLLWLVASGLGCLSNGLSLHNADGPVGESADCFVFITGDMNQTFLPVGMARTFEYFERYQLRAHRRTLSDIRAATEQLCTRRRHHIEHPAFPLRLPLRGPFCSQTLALDINGVLSFLAILTKIRDDYR